MVEQKLIYHVSQELCGIELRYQKLEELLPKLSAVVRINESLRQILPKRLSRTEGEVVKVQHLIARSCLGFET